MSMNYTGREPEISATDAEGVLFPTTPVWERGKKKRGFGARKAAPSVATPEARPMPTERTIAPEPRTCAAETPTTMTHSTLAADEAPFAAEPAMATRTTRVKRSGPSPTVIALALGAVVILGGVGFYAMQPHDGVTTLKPGEPSAEVALAPIAPVATSEVNPATNTLRPTPATPAPAAKPTQVARQSAPAPSARVRPARAAAPSADASSSNVSATIPDGPQPYSSLNPAAAPTQVTPPAPTQVTPAAPPPSEAAPPAAIPSTPPVQSAPAPTQAPAPETVTPPTN